MLFKFYTLIFLFFYCCTSSVFANQKRIALVIGNGDYKVFPSLENPVNDATDMEKKLKTFGFKVEKLLNANKRSIEEAISRFGKKLNQKDAVGLFYFAGHGLQVKGYNYLVPLGANIRDEADIKYEAVDAGRVLSKMELAENNLNLVILDACRNNPLPGKSRSMSRGLARMDAPKGSMILYATSPGSAALDGQVGSRNGMFTGNLLKIMSKPGLKIYDVFQQTAQAVNKASRSIQVPYIEGVILGDFYFNNKPKPKPIPVSQSTFQSIAGEALITKDRKEISFWDSVDKTPSVEGYQAYLQQYPNGHYKALASIKIQQLTKIKQAKIKKVKIQSVPTTIVKSKVIPTHANLTVRSNVRDDIVIVNGKKNGSTKLEVSLKSGVYVVEVKKPGYQPWERDIKIIAGQDQIVYAKLKPIPIANKPKTSLTQPRRTVTAIKKAQILTNKPILLTTSDCISSKPNKNKQINNCDKLLKMHPNNYQLLDTLGRLLDQKEDYKRSADVYNRALKVFPTDDKFLTKQSKATSNLEELTWLQNRKQQKKAEMKKKSMGSNSMSFKLNKIRCTRLKGKKGLKACNQALKINPRDDELYILKGDILAMQNRHRHAIQTYNKALKIKPGNTNVINKIKKIKKTL